MSRASCKPLSDVVRRLCHWIVQTLRHFTASCHLNHVGVLIPAFIRLHHQSIIDLLARKPKIFSNCKTNRAMPNKTDPRWEMVISADSYRFCNERCSARRSIYRTIKYRDRIFASSWQWSWRITANKTFSRLLLELFRRWSYGHLICQESLGDSFNDFNRARRRQCDYKAATKPYLITCLDVINY